MIIGIDGNEANVEKRVGVNQYGFELLHALRKLQGEWQSKHKIIIYLKRKPLRDMPREGSFFKYRVIPGGGVWVIRKLMPYLWLNKDRLELFFSPSHYLPFFSGLPMVCSIMDLGYLEFSEQFKKYDFWQLKYWSAYSIYISKAVIAISNSTKEDIVRHYRFASHKTFVTHLAFDRDRFNTLIKSDDVRHIKKKYSIVGDYILFLSTLKPSKNIEGLLSAFSEVIKEKPEVKLVIAGKKGWLYQTIFDRVNQLSLEGKVLFTDYVPEEDKPALISGAKVFVLPSFWEGFGLDVLNAMACGVLVVVSNRGSLPEVAGEAGIVVDPYSKNEIAKGLLKVLSLDDLEYNKLRQKALEQVARFSWESTARKTLEVFETIKK